jgi:hypothetical protein
LVPSSISTSNKRFALSSPLKAATLNADSDPAISLKNDGKFLPAPFPLSVRSLHLPPLNATGLKIELRQFSKFLHSTAWFSWWAQVICNTVAGVILFFTNSFVSPSAGGGSPLAARNIFSNGYVFAAGGLCLGAISIFWTWGFTGVAKRIRRAVLEPPTSLAMIRRVVRTAIFINLLGLLTALIGAEQFVGNLMARVLSQQGFSPLVINPGAGGGAIASPTVQPVDIFVIQANTNILLSHFISLVSSLLLLLRYSKISRAAGESN